MALKIRALRIVVNAGNKNFGAEYKFATSGLNVIRADNSSGKSTIFDSIIYALGLEAMLGASRQIPLKSILTTKVPLDDGSAVNISESYILLEIENGAGEIATIRRGVVSNDDPNLVTVYNGHLISKVPAPGMLSTNYYTRLPGSAQNERGFHNWLAKFINWDLPLVPKFSGSLTNLYLECIMPLMVIEQKKGWSQLQGTVPTQYGIKDVRKKAIEFAMKLDSEKISQQRTALNVQLAATKLGWSLSSEKVALIARNVGGTVEGIPKEPRSNFTETTPTAFKVSHESGWSLISERIEEVKSQIQQSKNLDTKSEKFDEATKLRLGNAEKALFELESMYRNLIAQQNFERSEKVLLFRRKETLSNDIRQLEDTHRISKMGGNTNAITSIDNCPVCESHIDGTVLSQNVNRVVMDIQSNVQFLKDELKTVELLNRHHDKNIEANEIAASDLAQRLDGKRLEIREIKESLLEDSRIPSKIEIIRQVNLERELLRLQAAVSDFETQLEALDVLSEQFAEIKGKIANLPDAYSEADEEKINYLRDALKENLTAFGFKSFDPAKIDISRESLHPIVEDFDWYFEASGSDNIRAIWAYSLALLSVASSNPTNHPGLLMFDEPGQQSSKIDSLRAFFRRAVVMANDQHQIIVTTSEKVDSLNEFLSNIPSTKFILPDGEKLIRPMRN